MKNRFPIIPLLIVYISIQIGCTPSDINTPIDNNTSVGCEDTNCSDYSSQQAAQAAYDADPECRNDLDHDNDGIACEHLDTTTTNCPTTGNCGCSGKNKDTCERDPCCQWKTNKGCKCK